MTKIDTNTEPKIYKNEGVVIMKWHTHIYIRKKKKETRNSTAQWYDWYKNWFHELAGGSKIVPPTVQSNT